MVNDKLKLNDDKAEFLIIGTPQQLATVSITSFRVGKAVTTSVATGRKMKAHGLIQRLRVQNPGGGGLPYGTDGDARGKF